MNKATTRYKSEVLACGSSKEDKVLPALGAHNNLDYKQT